MLTFFSLHRLSDWEGNAEELADTASQILAERGLSDDGVSPNVRLIRDYSQRGILRRPKREGKEARYTWRHLLEFVAARALVADGWPLAKIAEHIGPSSDSDLISFIPGGERGNPALAVARRLQQESRLAGEFAESTPAISRSAQPIAAQSSSDFRMRAAKASSLQSEMRDALRKLGLPEDGPAVEQITLIAIAPWCQVLIDSNRLPSISADEADEIGRTITAALLNPAIRKGAK